MLKDFFNFSKKRTPREAALFCLFHTALVSVVLVGLSALGI
ncbi:MAG TPA: hypothetical protein PKX87_10005 [Alphaproteobacteria bacterium]|nr:hypothetical protein [Alphaproteobacteria bacterium]